MTTTPNTSHREENPFEPYAREATEDRVRNGETEHRTSNAEHRTPNGGQDEHPNSNLKTAERPTSGVSPDLQAEREKLCRLLRGIAVMKESNAMGNDEWRMTNGEGTHPSGGERVEWRSENEGAEHRTPNEGQGDSPRVRKRAVYRQCKCFCTVCNSKTGATEEEAGSLLEAAPSHVDRCGCLCFCERCHEAEKELWRKMRNAEHRTPNPEHRTSNAPGNDELRMTNGNGKHLNFDPDEIENHSENMDSNAERVTRGGLALG